jgi:hypothetical protein
MARGGVSIAKQRAGRDDHADEGERHQHAHHDAGRKQGAEHGAAIVFGAGDALVGAAPARPLG